MTDLERDTFVCYNFMHAFFSCVFTFSLFWCLERSFDITANKKKSPPPQGQGLHQNSRPWRLTYGRGLFFEDTLGYTYPVFRRFTRPQRLSYAGDFAVCNVFFLFLVGNFAVTLFIEIKKINIFLKIIFFLIMENISSKKNCSLENMNKFDLYEDFSQHTRIVMLCKIFSLPEIA